MAGSVKESERVVDVTKLRATLTVRLTNGGFRSNLGLFGRSIQLELVSSELDTNTGLEKERLSGFAQEAGLRGEGVKYECNFAVPNGFGEIGGIFIENKHEKEIFIQDMILKNNAGATVVTISCNSWIQPKSNSSDKRIFFTASKSYLPDETPEGLLELRKRELELKRGNGKGERKSSDRIYDYEFYNDLGEPDEKDKNRVVLGGTKEFPYPRRCRTGRPLSKKDSRFETKSKELYTPRDERFSEVKRQQFSSNTFRAALMAAGPSIQGVVTDTTSRFPSFRSIFDMFVDGFNIPKLGGPLDFFKTLIPRIVEAIQDKSDDVLLFSFPELIKRDRFAWLRDEEFARETLAGINPYAIELVKELPLKSKLDPEVYGTAESAITNEIIEKQIFISAKEALKQKRLFMINYHDLFLPYVHKVRALEGTTLYGSRTLFFLTEEGILKPIAIELTRPPSESQPEWRQVFTPSSGSTDLWLWRLAKAHVCAHDSAHHELISHWLRTHCSVEPIIIAANRQLSEMHPIYRLLHPHFRYTLEINARARHSLINKGGIIESAFSPKQYSVEISSVVYGQFWRFDMEALPADLIRRGMAEEDPTAEHGLKLAISDYPFANDGLMIWSAIKKWVSDYVAHYYLSSTHVTNDSELQSWWSEVRNKGHPDKKDEPWWPELNTTETLIQTLTTIIWVASAQHAAVNFGQYQFGGYFPNRPTIARINMPTEDMTPEKFEKFLKKPEDTLLECFPTQLQAGMVLATLEVLSGHAPDEEYLGDKTVGQAWLVDLVVKEAYDKFHANLKEIEVIIDGRNSDPNLKNRFGAGIMPYELMKPYSGVGLTGKGIPNSISI
ncbi:hypothetical protein LUZ60_003371 [Juncus effusus]|nr:hypothetical protein LUZ60_003371 [Juncus effusus]